MILKALGKPVLSENETWLLLGSPAVNHRAQSLSPSFSFFILTRLISGSSRDNMKLVDSDIVLL